jgi:hypothetical protein
MPQYLSHALAIAGQLADVPGVRVVPDPPQVPMLHLLLTTSQEAFARTVRKLAAEQGIWTWQEATVTADPGVQRVELAVGDATCALQPFRVREILAAFVTRHDA